MPTTKRIVRDLEAGPIRCKFADGELRYLYVGDKEIIRRVYFAVRDKNWGTVMPAFTRVALRQTGRSFTIELDALCRSETSGVDFQWNGRIVGNERGEITFTASGEAGRDFGSNRIGLCVLYGAPSVVGQAFETVDAEGAVKPYVFPAHVSAPLVAPAYQTLRYTTENGMTVRTTVAGDARFDMEDQRTYGDTSFKAYAPLAYGYPNIPANVVKQETLTIQVENAPAVTAAEVARKRQTTVTLAAAVSPFAKVPRIATTPANPPTGNSIFGSVNGNREKHRGAATLVWGFDPSVHMPDEDTFLENAHAILDQAATARAFAPQAAIRIDPIRIGPPPTTGTADSRGGSAFAAAWAAIVVKYLSLAGVDEARFALGPGPADRALTALAAYAGQPVYAASVIAGAMHPAPVEAFAVDNEGAVVLFLVNRTENRQQVSVEGLPKSDGNPVERRRLHSDTSASENAADVEQIERKARSGASSSLTVELAPFEVTEIRL